MSAGVPSSSREGVVKSNKKIGKTVSKAEEGV